MEGCSGCPLRNWGWNDNGYGAFGPLVYFASTGLQTLRVQRREDGISIDQIVLSPSQYLTSAPGLPFDDQTILPPTGALAPPPPAAVAPTPPPPPSYAEILMTSDSVTALSGGWRMITDTTAALAAPTHYVELTFHAEAGRAYRLWVRGRADANSWANDSVFVQFDSSLTAAGQPAARIGTSGSYTVNMEEDRDWGVSGWGWQDNGYGVDVLGPRVCFAAKGPQTIRIQTREDGLRIDQVVLSSEKYLTSSPGLLENDGTILK